MPCSARQGCDCMLSGQASESQQRQIVGFGTSAGEYQPVGIGAAKTCSEQFPNPLSGVFQGPASLSARLVLATRIGSKPERSFTDCIGSRRQDRGGGIEVEVDRVGHAGIVVLGHEPQAASTLNSWPVPLAVSDCRLILPLQAKNVPSYHFAANASLLHSRIEMRYYLWQ